MEKSRKIIDIVFKTISKLSDDEIEIIKKNDVKISHNPCSNMKLASGIAPVSKLIENDICDCDDCKYILKEILFCLDKLCNSSFFIIKLLFILLIINTIYDNLGLIGVLI